MKHKSTSRNQNAKSDSRQAETAASKIKQIAIRRSKVKQIKAEVSKMKNAQANGNVNENDNVNVNDNGNENVKGLSEAAAPKAAYGTYHNVFLSHSELQALKRDFSDYQAKIERL